VNVAGCARLWPVKAVETSISTPDGGRSWSRRKRAPARRVAGWRCACRAHRRQHHLRGIDIPLTRRDARDPQAYELSSKTRTRRSTVSAGERGAREPLVSHGCAAAGERRAGAGAEAAGRLRPSQRRGYPHEFPAGAPAHRIAGHRRRSGFIVADEAVSALDVSIPGQIINL
jgi:hypothetical protein